MRKPAAPTGQKRPAAVWRALMLIASVLAAVGALMLVHHVLKPADAVYMTVDGTAVGSDAIPDINGDGTVNSLDAAILRRFLILNK